MARHTTALASTSSSSAPYSVFINHRGLNVKETFASHLYRTLCSHGLRVFLDKPELEGGDEIFSQVKTAIQVASVHITIFSENYATSKWCLDELCLMVDSEKRGATILPIFYHVKPSELRWTGSDIDGPYAKALRKHEDKQRDDSRRIQSWREALSHVSDISGFELEACNGDEGELLEKVVQRVLTRVRKPVLHVSKYATGLGAKIEDFEKTVSFQQEYQPVGANVVGIIGVGGIGKTTVAKEIFNRKRSYYDGSSFLADVREKAARSFLPSLQSKLLKDLKGINREIEGWEEGIGILETCVSSCNALIIIDDIDDADQLDAFLPIKGVLDPRSLILVTSRDKHVLLSAGIPKASLYHLKGLNEPHTQELFCSHAFFQPHPRPGFENLVVRFVNACHGVPLSLKVLGALLCGKGIAYWEEKLNEVQRLPNKILTSLKICYDSLDQNEQQIFLDIACFARGEERDKWVRIWGGLAGLQTLEDRCLVEMDSEKMRMHDHLRDMERNIAEEVSMPRRLWRSIEDVQDLFEEQSSSSVIPEVRGIRMPFRRTFEEELLRSRSEIPLNKFSSHQAFRMRKLQLLETEGDFVEGILSRVRSPNLIWLRWIDCPWSSLPRWIPMDHLKVLEVEGRALKKLWHCDSQVPLQLRELYVDSPLSEFPKSIEKLKHLEKIVLVNYSDRFPEPADLSTLPTLPEEFFHVRSLKYLELAGCFGILPNEFGNLTNLQCIVLSGCQRLKKLPASFTDLTNLQHLKLSGCDRLKRLPKSLGDLTNLQHITLYGCKRLKRLPNSLGDLSNLQHIHLYGCKSLKKLPNSLGDLTNLQRIIMEECESLEVLPDSIGNLRKLQHIDLHGCESLEVLPDSFGNSTNLQYINLLGCESLEALPDSFGNLTNLQHINLLGCESLEVLPDSFGNLTNLQHINLQGCKSLEVLPDSFANLTNLLHIEFSGFKRLKKLPDSFADLTNLQHLKLSGCARLKRLPKSFGKLTNLQDIYLSVLKGLKKLPNSLGDLTNLQQIDLVGCEMEVLPNSFQNLTNIRHITLIGCHSLKRLPDSFGNLKNLQTIYLQDCSLNTLPKSSAHLTNLRSINLTECRSLKMLPNHLFGNLTKLRDISLSDCESLEKLPDSLGNLRKLRFIRLDRCKSLKLPNSLGNLLQLELLELSRCCKSLPTTLGNITTLKFLDFSGCVQMEVLPAKVEHQKSLEMLNLLGTNLKELTNAHIVCLSSLTYFYLGSPSLKELPHSLGCLSSLKILLLHGCQELKRLPDSVGLLTQLTTLEISKCGIDHLPAPALMEMNNLKIFRVRACPLLELPFKEESASRRKRKRSPKDKGLIGLNELELYCTDISEISFPEGVCINLQTLCIRRCNDLEKVGLLPATLGHLILRGCGALSKIEGLSGLAKPLEVDIRGCYNVQVEELRHLVNFTRLFTPGDPYNRKEEDEVEKEMAALQDGVLPSRFPHIYVGNVTGSPTLSPL